MAMTNVSTRELLGDLREAAREARAYRETVRGFYEKHPNLHDDFPDKCVAVYRDTVLTANSFDDLFAEMDRRGLPRERTFTTFVTREPETLIF